MTDDLIPRLQMLASLMGDPRPRATVRDAITEIERLRAALEYYAGRHNYIGRIDQLGGKAYPSAVIVDNGNMARAALAEEKHDDR